MRRLKGSVIAPFILYLSPLSHEICLSPTERLSQPQWPLETVLGCKVRRRLISNVDLHCHHHAQQQQQQQQSERVSSVTQ